MVLIYNPVALTTVYGEQARQLSADHAQPHMLDAGGAQVPVAVMAARVRPWNEFRMDTIS